MLSLAPGVHERLERICLDALRHEAMAWPKPGLVSPVDSGSHRDMHLGTLLASIDALRGSFAMLADAGAQNLPYSALQRIAIRAEQNMLRATNNINTHRGALFVLGLLAAAAGLRHANRALCGLSCGAIVALKWVAEIAASRKQSPTSHGNTAFQKFSAGGARSEAANGFPTLYQIGLPALRHHLKAGHSMEIARIGTLMALMEHLEDTNLLWRGGISGLEFVKSAALAFNRAGGVNASGWQQHLVSLHREFVLRNLSPGGSADLLSACCALNLLEDERT